MISETTSKQTVILFKHQLEFTPFYDDGRFKASQDFLANHPFSEPTVRKSEIVLLDYLHRQPNLSTMLLTLLS